jgi:ribosome biogenesis protein Nip4
MKPIISFAAQLGTTIALKLNYTVRKGNRYFLLNPNLNKVIRKDFYYAGTYLGKVKNGKFFPSFNLLAMLAKTEANKVTVDHRSAWLFICGRDIFQKGITAVQGSRQKGSHALVLNEFGECLGFGKIVHTLSAEDKGNEVAVKNISDIGDFLRRES